MNPVSLRSDGPVRMLQGSPGEVDGGTSGRKLESARILVVEDDPRVREALTELLKLAGAEVTATGSGLEAIGVAARDEFSVLLTDLGLPDIAGHVLIRRILAIALRRPRVIVLTGYGEPFLSLAREAGADVVLMKPLEWPSLLAHLRSTYAPSGAA